MYIEVKEIDDDHIRETLSQWRKDIFAVMLRGETLAIDWKSKGSYRLRGWRAERAFRYRVNCISHQVNGKTVSRHYTAQNRINADVERLLRAA